MYKELSRTCTAIVVLINPFHNAPVADGRGFLKLPNAIPSTFQDNSFMDTSKAFRVCGVGDGEAGEKRREPQRKEEVKTTAREAGQEKERGKTTQRC